MVSEQLLFYQQVLDIFATSIDYDGKSEAAREFFQTVQNKMLYAVTGYTAPELIFCRLDSTKDDLGLTTYNRRGKGYVWVCRAAEERAEGARI
jgi:hypothetical protein